MTALLYPAIGLVAFGLGVAALGRFARRRAPLWLVPGVALLAVSLDALRALEETLAAVREPWARPLVLGLVALAAALRVACEWSRLGARGTNGEGVRGDAQGADQDERRTAATLAASVRPTSTR